MALGFVKMGPGIDDLGKLEDVFDLLLDPHWAEKGGASAAMSSLIDNRDHKACKSLVLWLIHPDKQEILDLWPEINQELARAAGDLAFQITSEGWSRLVSFVETSWLTREIMVTSHAIKHGNYQGAGSAIHAIQQLTLAALSIASSNPATLVYILEAVPLTAGMFEEDWIADDKPVFLFDVLRTAYGNPNWSTYGDYLFASIIRTKRILRDVDPGDPRLLEIALGLARFISHFSIERSIFALTVYKKADDWGLGTSLQTVLFMDSSCRLANSFLEMFMRSANVGSELYVRFAISLLARYLNWIPEAKITPVERLIVVLAKIVGDGHVVSTLMSKIKIARRARRRKTNK